LSNSPQELEILGNSQLESKIVGKTILIPLDRLVEHFGSDAIERSKIRVENRLATSDGVDKRFNWALGHSRNLCEVKCFLERMCRTLR
jgi:hypothetical protein